MSYLVLARKWRPQNFDEVIGQGHVTRTLKNALETGRIAHALIFSGPRGVGKTSIARILAKSLNCQNGPTPYPCNKCQLCQEITAGVCVDVNEIDGASNRGIDEIRQLREEVRFQPVEARYRIYIIDEVHMLTKEAFNALLKTLEEPPPHAYFIFATTEPRKIPETIHSRCQHFEFKRLSESTLAKHLEVIASSEGLDLDKHAIMAIARQAKGSVRDSLSLLDQVIAFGAKNYEEVCEALGIAGPTSIEELAKAVLSGDAEACIIKLDELYNRGIDLFALAQDLVKFLRDLSLAKRLSQDAASTLTKLDKDRIRELLERFEQIEFLDVLSAMKKLSAYLSELYRNPDPRILLELVLLEICQAPSAISIDTLISELEALLTLYEKSEGLVCDKEESNKALKDESRQVAKGFPTYDSIKNRSRPIELKEKWAQFREFVNKKKPHLGAHLTACKEISIGEDNSFIIKCNPDFTGEMLCDRETAKEISELASDFFDSNIDIKFVLSQPKKEKKLASNTKKSPADELVGHPLVQEAINIFQARISSVSLDNRKKQQKGVKSHES